MTSTAGRAPTTSSYSITMRLHTAPDHGVVGAVATAISEVGGIVTGIDVAESSHERLVVDVTCSAADAEHAERLQEAADAVPGVSVHKTSDRVFLLHIGGKIEVSSKVPLRNRDDLSMAYTPGVGRVSLALAEHPEDVRRLTVKGNSVAVVTDGSAVLGLGNIGPGAALPVMEGKAALFKRFADIDAWPICLDSQDTDEIVRAVQLIAPGFGGINLEDISAPRCFEIEDRLKERLDIPVFHDDQHGTAVVALAALQNALKLTGREHATTRVVISGAGAAGVAIAKILIEAGIEDIAVTDRKGVVHSGRDDLTPVKKALAEITADRTGRSGTLAEALDGADVYLGVSGGTIPEEDVARMAPEAIIFAMANPTPEVHPDVAHKYARIVATGRSDFPNQINNVLAFPGIFRGAFDVHATAITEGMKLAAATALAELVGEDLREDYVIPGPFDPRVPGAVSSAVAEAARADGVARR